MAVAEVGLVARGLVAVAEVGLVARGLVAVAEVGLVARGLVAVALGAEGLVAAADSVAEGGRGAVVASARW